VFASAASVAWRCDPDVLSAGGGGSRRSGSNGQRLLDANPSAVVIAQPRRHDAVRLVDYRVMGVRDRAFAAVARQLGRPSGPAGRAVGRALNRGNRAVIEAAVGATRLRPGSIAADVGFGGGVGLAMLLERTAPDGVVHGIEIAPTMLAQARRRFAREINDGRLRLHEAAMDRLPLLDESVDAVVSTNTIYFVDDLQAAMAELVRVVIPGGRLVLGIGDPEAMAGMPFTRHGFRLRPIATVVDRLTAVSASLIEDIRVGEDARSFHVLVAEVGRA
jgi:arsenite methyltransferase